MPRFISNYTILANGQLLINHITTIDDDGTLISIEPFDRELGNTIYVPQPICITNCFNLHIIEETFINSASRQQLELNLATLNLSHPQPGDNVAVMRLDFARNTLTQL